jgi:pyridoxal phosphate enzyme (YggS family)
LIGRRRTRAGRDPAAIDLVAVSKTKPPAAVATMIECGQSIFGENRVQEAQAKFAGLNRRPRRLHLIGPLQTNKARDAVALFDCIDSLDRPRLADALETAAQAAGKLPRLLVQVNIGDEPQKAGVARAEADRFIAACLRRFPGKLAGLMCIPPAEQDPSGYFADLAAMARRHGLATLSMGMSADFALAIAAGATEVRVGSALFGGRDKGDINKQL